MTARKPSPPAGLAARGKAFWTATIAANELSETETELLLEVCRGLDVADALAQVIAEEGVSAVGSKGQRVTHPAVTEARQLAVVLGRLLAQLAIPDAEEETVDSPTTVRARHAAQARWHRRDAIAGRKASR